MCVVEKAGFEPRILGTEAERATLAHTDTWQKERRLRLHHAGIAHLVKMVNKFGGEGKHILCADGQV